MSCSNPLQCENCLKNETAKFQELYQKFSKEKVTHLQALKGILPRRFQFLQECGWKAWIITCSITSHILWSISLSNCCRFVACNNICYTSCEHDNIQSNEVGGISPLMIWTKSRNLIKFLATTKRERIFFFCFESVRGLITVVLGFVFISIGRLSGCCSLF